MSNSSGPRASLAVGLTIAGLRAVSIGYAAAVCTINASAPVCVGPISPRLVLNGSGGKPSLVGHGLWSWVCEPASGFADVSVKVCLGACTS